jgi:hypothetical protein
VLELGRSVGWGLNFNGTRNPFNEDFQYGHQEFAKFVDNPNILMMVTNQHHNVSTTRTALSTEVFEFSMVNCMQFTQEKVISLPLGVTSHKELFRYMKHLETLKNRYDMRTLLPSLPIEPVMAAVLENQPYCYQPPPIIISAMPSDSVSLTN